MRHRTDKVDMGITKLRRIQATRLLEVVPKFGQVVKVESRSDRRNLECHERDEATRLS